MAERSPSMEFGAGEKVEAFKSFEEMGLEENLVEALHSYGYVRPTAIQQRAIVPAIKGRDLIGQAHSGTGKTVAFALPALQLLLEAEKIGSRTLDMGTRVLVLEPTRELALQVREEIYNIGGFMNVHCHACVSSHGPNFDKVMLDYGQEIIVGTPGRILDLIRHQILRTAHINMLVLDEADELLDENFKEQIRNIYRFLPPGTQVLLFSTTLPHTTLEMSTKFMRDPIQILIIRDEIILDGLQQYFVVLEHKEWKLQALLDLFKSTTIAQALVFCNTKNTVNWLGTKLLSAKIKVSVMHSDIFMEERNKIIEKFRRAESRILISTDIWARGLDFEHVTVVVNYDVPRNRELYIHRVGRTARYGTKGVAITFTRPNEVPALRDFEQYYATQIDELPVKTVDPSIDNNENSNN